MSTHNIPAPLAPQADFRWTDLKPLLDGRLPLAKRSRLPTSSGVYLVYCGWHTLYVGECANLKKRWVSHHKLPWLKQMPSPHLAFRLLPTAERRFVEREWVALLRPYLQGQQRFAPADTARIVARRIAGREAGTTSSGSSLFARLGPQAYFQLASILLAGIFQAGAVTPTAGAER